MRTILITALLQIATSYTLASAASNARPDPNTYLLAKEGKLVELDKTGALRELLLRPGSTVYKCSPQEVSPKATLRNKKTERQRSTSI